jgi:orotate phosphoribosyltransferase
MYEIPTKQGGDPDMEQYKKDFIEFMVESQVLKFGEFTLKSGRKSPFFMNAGAYVTGSQLRRLGQYYAEAIHDHYGTDFDVLFGPAYKGIPLSVAATIAFSELYGKDIKYCSNRKEEKDHGDAGILLGSPIKDGDRVVIIEDVTTSGKSIEETFPIIRAQGDVEIVGLMVSLNRMERGKGSKSALEEIQELYGFKANAIVSMADVVEHLYNRECLGQIVIDDKIKSAIDAYYEQYGVK